MYAKPLTSPLIRSGSQDLRGIVAKIDKIIIVLATCSSESGMGEYRWAKNFFALLGHDTYPRFVPNNIIIRS